MYRKILVPLDGSALAEHVLPHVAALAPSAQAQVILLRVVNLPTSMLASDTMLEPEKFPSQATDHKAALAVEMKAAEAYLESVAERLRAETGMDVVRETREGQPAQEIVHVVLEESVDLITLCTHGRSGLRRLVFGSVADRVLREAGRPALLIKASS